MKQDTVTDETASRRVLDRVVMRRVADLTPYAHNARTHSAEQVAQIARSIQEFGFVNPVLVDGEGGIMAGHGRVLAAQSLGMVEVPTLDVGWLSPAQRRAYILADNQLALNAGWDDALLQAELRGLDELGFDLPILGFSDQQLEELLWSSAPGETDPDEAPLPPAAPVSALGDVWTLGKHRLVCGDCTDSQVVGKVLVGVKPHLMVTDPPYGVDYDPKWRTKVDGARRSTGVVLNDDRVDWCEAWALFPGDVAYVWHAGVHSPAVAGSLAAADFEMRALIVWAKSKHTFGRGHYHHMHEPCWYAVRKSGNGHWTGDRKQTTLWAIDTNRANDTGHSTQKPVECMRRPIENNSSVGQAVYDPFVGSGTTLIAAEMTGRACHAIELNPAYVDVCVMRWQEYTGEQAIHAESGATFGELRLQRNPTSDG